MRSEKRKRKAAVGRICRKKGLKSGMKERVGDGKLIITGMPVSGIYKRGLIYSQRLLG